MEQYITQLLKDLELIIVQRWQANPPHFFQAGFLNEPYLEPPKDWKKEKVVTLSRESPLALDLSIQDMEKWLDNEGESSMFSHFGLKPEQFPPADKLTKEQLKALNLKLLRLWASFNFGASVPEKLPEHLIYPMLLKTMLKPKVLMNFGHSGIEFCHYEPKECPFPKEYCSCLEYG